MMLEINSVEETCFLRLYRRDPVGSLGERGLRGKRDQGPVSLVLNRW